jgi:hypothetical protein
VWPFEAKRDVLRIARQSVELWVREGSGLVRAESRPVKGAEGLSAQLGELLKAYSGGRKSGPGAVDVVVESAWMPLVLLETGHNVWASAAVERLLRHRLANVYEERGESVAAWHVAVDHLPGERFGVGYGLPPRVRAAVEEALDAAGCGLASLQPAFQWGRRQSSAKAGWWVWLEEDRAIVGFLEQGRVTALQPAADLPRSSPDLARLLRTEQLRAGIDGAACGVAVSGWEPPFAIGTTSDLTWQGVAKALGGLAAAEPARSAA